jgi:multidrug efflux pump subunit AcrA (membrane-fusion protein)
MTTAHEKPEWAQSKREKENARRVAEGLKPKRRIGPWVVLGLVVIGGVVFFATRSPAPVEPTEAAEAAPVVRQLLTSEITEIAPATLRQRVKVTGTLVPAKQAVVASQAAGRVLSVAVRPGDSVKEGQVLVEIDQANLALQLAQQRATADATRAQLVSSQQQLERTEELARQGLTSPSALEQARSANAAMQANLTALESAVSAAELALSNATVRAPIDGIVSERSVEPGQTIGTGTALFTLVNLQEMDFQASASINSSALVSPGQPVEVIATGLDNQTFEGRACAAACLPPARSPLSKSPMPLPCRRPPCVKTPRAAMCSSSTTVRSPARPSNPALPGIAAQRSRFPASTRAML